MAIKKSELYSTLWKSCDELRGGMDASQYKDDEFHRFDDYGIPPAKNGDYAFLLHLANP